MNTLYKADTFPEKISVGVGAYRDEQGKPYILPVVKKAEQLLANDPTVDHEYLPIDGLKSFYDASAKLILGDDSPVIKEKRYIACQSISGTGAVRLGAEFLARFRKATVYISNPTWGNHTAIFRDAGMEVKEYSYWNPKTKGLDYEGFFGTMENAPDGSIFVLHACAHNPTGVDPTQEQWKRAAEIMKAKGHFPFFDCAYQGCASGDLDRDAWPVRYFIEQGFEVCISQSYAKNFGLYGQRVGCLVIVMNDASKTDAVRSQVNKIVRAIYSTPPAYGARIAALVMNDPQFFNEWKVQLKGMSDRIIKMRQMLFDALQRHQTPGTWNHIIDQIGMFSYTGLTPKQSRTLVEKFHIYLTENGRISMAGLNEGNIARFAECMDWVVRHVDNNLNSNL